MFFFQAKTRNYVNLKHTRSHLACLITGQCSIQIEARISDTDFHNRQVPHYVKN